MNLYFCFTLLGTSRNSPPPVQAPLKNISTLARVSHKQVNCLLRSSKYLNCKANVWGWPQYPLTKLHFSFPGFVTIVRDVYGLLHFYGLIGQTFDRCL